MARSNTTYLYKVRNTFYFRIRIPSDLACHFGGRLEVKRSLKTKSLKLARRLLRVSCYRAEEVFTTMRSGILTPEQIKQLADCYLRDTLSSLEEHRSSGAGIPSGPGELRYKLQEHEDTAKNLKAALSYNVLGAVAQEVTEYLAAKHALNIDTEAPEFKQLTREIIKRKLEVLRVEGERLQGNYLNGYDDAPQVSTAPPALSPSPTPKKTALPLSELIDKYIAEYRRTGKALENSVKEYDSMCRLFQGALENKEAPDITRDDIRNFHEILKRFPRHTNKRKQYRGKTVAQILKMTIPEGETLGDTSIEKYMVRITALLKWATVEGYIEKNPAEGIQHVRPKSTAPKEPTRNPFTREEIQNMVDGFLTVATLGKLKEHPERIWIPLLALFTGARSNELAQLHIDDIQQEKGTGIWYIRIAGDAEGKKRVKTQSSNRIVPIHPILLELGLLEYFTSLKRKKAPRLWMQLRQSKTTGKYQKNFENWFNLSSHGKGFKYTYITTDRTKVFHCFRNTLVTALKQALVEESVIQDIAGHSAGTITFDTYSQAHTLKTMLEAMQRIDYGVDFGRLKAITATYY